MSIIFHKKIIINEKKSLKDSTSINIHGKIIGWTDGEKIINSDDIKKNIEDRYVKDGPGSIATFMRGIVGPCVIEIVNNNDFWFFASCASGGFYWILDDVSSNGKQSYLISNDEGRFLRQTFHMKGRLNDGALMNAILSHQSVIRPLFDGLVTKSKRCPPGFYMKFSRNKTELKSYILNNQIKTRKQQDIIIKKKMKAINSVYKTYCKINGARAKLAFSGGVDSTALLLNHKDFLDEPFQGYYISRGKLSEIKMAAEIANRANCKIDFIEPYESFSVVDIKKKAEAGLSVMNGLVYMKHAFCSYPYENNDKVETLILTGQNSDTLFHIDTFAASSFSKGVIRAITMTKGIIYRFKTTIIFFTLSRLLKNNNKHQNMPSGIVDTYTSLNEHDTGISNLPDGVIKIIKDYKKEKYVLPFRNWLSEEFDLGLNNLILSSSERDNHIARLARWLRTVGNFHQQFVNTSKNENIVICTPYSEGPLAVELLSYRLGIRDVIFPKRFLHKYIQSKLHITYNKIRKLVLNDRLIYYPQQIIYYGYKYIKQKIKKFVNGLKRNNHKSLTSNQIISIDDLSKLREVLGHKNGIVERFFLKNINDDDCKKYLNYLYDCIELKVNFKKIDNVEGMHLCRLVNLQIMLNKKD